MVDELKHGLPFGIRGLVVHGHGRGGKMLGFPTANIELPPKIRSELYQYSPWSYCGWGLIEKPQTDSQPSNFPYNEVLPIAISIGPNPHFEDNSLTLEVHFIDKLPGDFYGSYVRLVTCSSIRKQRSFENLDLLISAIKSDCATVEENLPSYYHWALIPIFTNLEIADHTQTEKNALFTYYSSIKFKCPSHKKLKETSTSI